MTILSGSFTGKGKDELGLKMEKLLRAVFFRKEIIECKYFKMYDTVKYQLLSVC